MVAELLWLELVWLIDWWAGVQVIIKLRENNSDKLTVCKRCHFFFLVLVLLWDFLVRVFFVNSNGVF